MLENLKYKLQEIKGSLGGRQFLSLLLFLIILFAIPLTVYLVKQRQELRSKADVGRVVLTFGANNIGTKAPGEEFAPVDLVLNAGDNNITGVDITIAFDNTIEAVKFEPQAGNFDYTVIPGIKRPNNIDNSTSPRTVRYVAVNKGANTKSGPGLVLGKVWFKAAALTSGDPKVRFGDAHAVSSGRTEELEVAKDSTVAYLVQNTPGPTSTPTPSPTPSPTPVPGRMAGDADGNSCVDNADRLQWVKERNGDCHRCTNWSNETAPKRNYGQDYTLWYTAFANKPSLCTTATVPNCTTIACQ